MSGRPSLVTRFVLSVALLAVLPAVLSTSAATAAPVVRPLPTWQLTVPPDAVTGPASKAGRVARAGFVHP